MVERLKIANYKSIKDLTLECKRINVFIGEPNSGKSNLLESLALFWACYSRSLRGLTRTSDLTNLFYENDLSNEVTISTGPFNLNISYRNGVIQFLYTDNRLAEENEWKFDAGMNDGHLSPSTFPRDFKIHPYYFRLYDFKAVQRAYEFLLPPHGDNLFPILQTNRELRNWVSEFIKDRGFKLTLRQASSEIEISKEENSILTTYPYAVISDTLQRMIFYVAAIETNKPDSTLIFEEPESNIFPYYTSYLAEKIAGDSDKQYFITTHNANFLQRLVEKTPMDQISVSLVTLKSYQTKVHTLTEKGLTSLLDLNNDVFLNFDKLVDA